MKPKPKPTKELKVVRFEQCIRLIPYSEDAKIFVVTEAHNYGSVLRVERSYSLEIEAGYDVSEVAEYFESYNDD